MAKKSSKYRTVYLDKVAIYYIREYMKERGVSREQRTAVIHTFVWRYINTS